MLRKKSLMIVMLLIMTLALPVSALAATVNLNYSGGTLTINYPDSYTSCTPVDMITVSGITAGHPITIYFLRYDASTGFFYTMGSAYLTADGSVPFPYPQINGTLTFGITIVDEFAGRQIRGYKWTVTCSPPPGGQGCTPGYWRNHYDSWPVPYMPSGSFNAAFLIPANYYAPGFFSDGYTLGQAIWQGGGGLNRLARHGTAALLSAASPFVNYPYTVAEVIAMVQSGMIDPLAQANELGCPLN